MTVEQWNVVLAIACILVSGATLSVLFLFRRTFGAYTNRIERSNEQTRKSNELTRQSNERALQANYSTWQELRDELTKIRSA